MSTGCTFGVRALGKSLNKRELFLFSATAGQLADRYEKPRLIRYIKLAELFIMALAAVGFMQASLGILLTGIFLMGLHSAFLGPLKYSILPQLVAVDELVAGNALVEMGTFLAILAGTIGGGVLVLAHAGPVLVACAIFACAVFGYLASLRLPSLPAVAPGLQIGYSPIAPTLEILRITHKTRAVFLSVLGISWFWFFGAAFLTVLPTYARVTLGGLGAPVHVAVAHSLDFAAFFHAPHALRILADLFGIAMFGGFYTVPLYTLIQQRAEPAERSRVVAGNNVINALFMVTIPIAPEHENKEMLERAFAKIAEELRAGEIVCIFPEGKLTKDGELNPFKAGIELRVRELLGSHAVHEATTIISGAA